MNIDVRQLRCLVAIADNGTFTDAAIELSISQAAVSRTIAALETELGVRLLRRTTRHVAPTAVGSRVLDRARRIIAEIDDLRRVINDEPELHVGYAWSALGSHTTTLQRRWAQEHPDITLVFVQYNSPTAGLSEGAAEIAVVRRPLQDARFETALIATEARYAALPVDDPLARRRFVRLADFAGRTVGLDSRTGTTTIDLWEPGSRPAATRDTRSVDEWLTLIAAGQAIGITSEATAAQYPRPGVAYRPVRDAQPLPVWLAWWRDEPPVHRNALIRLACDVYRSGPVSPKLGTGSRDPEGLR
jgi:DNA-binding transcriptional LysR family regulator